jgi:hypothetical protein
LSSLFSQTEGELVERGIGDEGDVRGCVGGFSSPDVLEVHDGNATAGPLQEACGGDAGDTASDDKNVDFYLPTKLQKVQPR